MGNLSHMMRYVFWVTCIHWPRSVATPTNTASSSTLNPEAVTFRLCPGPVPLRAVLPDSKPPDQIKTVSNRRLTSDRGRPGILYDPRTDYPTTIAEFRQPAEHRHPSRKLTRFPSA